ncbi:uncharacterized protein A4U43_C08F28940 [Asparagus officinalis]|nr:uncharacterized protein A4U43_C08F28940 [Asparagus officinalis]
MTDASAAPKLELPADMRVEIAVYINWTPLGVGFPRALQRINLGIRQVRRPRRGARKPVRASSNKSRPSPVERHDVRVDRDGRDRTRVRGELIGDQNLSGPVLEEEKKQGVPNNALKDNNLNHKRPGVFPIHRNQQRDPHDEGVGQRREGEQRDGPVEGGGSGGDASPDEEGDEDYQFLEGVGGDEVEVHGVGIVGGDEVEGEQGDGEERDEAVDAGALIRAENLPPLDGAVGEDHRHVQGHHGRHYVVEIRQRYHFDDRSFFPLSFLDGLCRRPRRRRD